MSTDVILDETANFIMENEEHLNLAFRVEEAMPRVRETLIREVLDGIKRRFSEGDCEIIEFYNKDISATQARLILRSKDWPKSVNVDETGVQLRTDKSNWSDVYIWLYIPKELTEKISKRQDLMEELNELRKSRENSETPLHWDHLSDDLRNWSSEKFLRRALKSKSRERMVDEITDLLKVWWNRKEVQQILSLAERSCAE
ncbi:MAG: hypothetical protein OXB98_12765 [Bryobacterales bacterium]|nr:hypothetical protein [Bryobacterales bacterium]